MLTFVAAVLGTATSGPAGAVDAAHAATARWEGTLRYRLERNSFEHMPRSGDYGLAFTRKSEYTSVQTWKVSGRGEVSRVSLRGRTSLEQTSREDELREDAQDIVCRNPDGTERSRTRVVDTTQKVTTEQWRAQGRDYFDLRRLGGRWRIVWSTFNPLDSRGHDLEDLRGSGTSQLVGTAAGYFGSNGCDAQRQVTDLTEPPEPLDGPLAPTVPDAVTTKVRSRSPRRIAGRTTVTTNESDGTVVERYTFAFTRRK